MYGVNVRKYGDGKSLNSFIIHHTPLHLHNSNVRSLLLRFVPEVNDMLLLKKIKNL